MVSILHLQKQGLLSPEKNRILDIGPQNVYYAKTEEIKQFLAHQGGSRLNGEDLDKELERLVYFSTPRPGERTTFFAEIADLTYIDYLGIDVAPAPKTELLDLNFDSLPFDHHDRFDVVLNFGTTEHIFNQWNCFKVIHDSLAVGGVIYCIVPMSGYMDHGYYCYTPLFFSDLAKANNYELRECFAVLAGVNDLTGLSTDVRDDWLHPVEADSRAFKQVPCFNIHAIMQKREGAPFKVSLETETTHAIVSEEISRKYKAAVAPEELEEQLAARSMSGAFDTAYLNDQITSLKKSIAQLQTANMQLQSTIAQRAKSDGHNVQLAERNRELEEIVRQLTAERDRSHEEVGALLSSSSWRVTEPLRRAAQWVRSK